MYYNKSYDIWEPLWAVKQLFVLSPLHRWKEILQEHQDKPLVFPWWDPYKVSAWGAEGGQGNPLKWLRQPRWHLSPRKFSMVIFSKSIERPVKKRVFSSTCGKDGIYCSLKKVLVEIPFILKQMRIGYAWVFFCHGQIKVKIKKDPLKSGEAFRHFVFVLNSFPKPPNMLGISFHSI